MSSSVSTRLHLKSLKSIVEVNCWFAMEYLVFHRHLNVKVLQVSVLDLSEFSSVDVNHVLDSIVTGNPELFISNPLEPVENVLGFLLVDLSIFECDFSLKAHQVLRNVVDDLLSHGVLDHKRLSVKPNIDVLRIVWTKHIHVVGTSDSLGEV